MVTLVLMMEIYERRREDEIVATHLDCFKVGVTTTPTIAETTTAATGHHPEEAAGNHPQPLSNSHAFVPPSRTVLHPKPTAAATKKTTLPPVVTPPSFHHKMLNSSHKRMKRIVVNK